MKHHIKNELFLVIGFCLLTIALGKIFPSGLWWAPILGIEVGRAYGIVRASDLRRMNSAPAYVPWIVVVGLWGMTAGLILTSWLYGSRGIDAELHIILQVANATLVVAEVVYSYTRVDVIGNLRKKLAKVRSKFEAYKTDSERKIAAAEAETKDVRKELDLLRLHAEDHIETEKQLSKANRTLQKIGSEKNQVGNMYVRRCPNCFKFHSWGIRKKDPVECCGNNLNQTKIK